MKDISAHRFGDAPDGAPGEEEWPSGANVHDAPKSGVQRKQALEPLRRIRRLAQNAESLGLDPLAFELLFAAVRIESGSRVDAVRCELAETAEIVPELEARFYRRAVRTLATATSVD
jgi:hypothetical protein